MTVNVDELRKWGIPISWAFARLEDFGSGINAIVDGPFGSNLKRSDYIKDQKYGVPVLSFGRAVKPPTAITN